MINRLICVLGSVFLAITLLAAGLATCCLPATTDLLAQATEHPQNSPYGSEQLARLAQATRAYTVDFRFTGTDAALDQLSKVEVEAAQAACQNTAKARLWSAKATKAALDVSESPIEQARQLAAVSDRYALDDAALSHLDDCNRLIAGAAPVLGLCAAAAIAIAVVLAVRKQHQTLGRMLTAGPAVMAAALVLLAVWAAVDFVGFFQAFHGLLFPQGNWTFPVDSLLITMYPTNFWMGMGAVWATTTIVLSILCLGFGIRFKKNRGTHHD